MIEIDKNSLRGIEKEFYKHLAVFLRMDDEGNSIIDAWIADATRVDARLAEMYRFYKDKYIRISEIDSTEKLWDINKEFYAEFQGDISIWLEAKKYKRNPDSPGILKGNTPFEKFKAKMTSVYEDFMGAGLDGYENIGEWLANELNILCCPYCNRHYTFTILKNKKHPTFRPQFDHFLPKSVFPLTAVCFFNLIPACPECNKAKGDKILDIHPYEDSFDKRGIRFSYDETTDRRNPTIQVNYENNPNIKKLALLDLYQKHSDIATDLINKAEAYNACYYDSLVDSFPGLGMTQQEIQRAIWGVSLSEKDMIKRPFSKFTRDILFQLGIKY